MAKYKSTHTGEQIDDAVDAVTDGTLLSVDTADTKYLKLQGGGTIKRGNPSVSGSEYSELEITPIHIFSKDVSGSRYTFTISANTNMEIATGSSDSISLSAGIIKLIPSNSLNIEGNISLLPEATTNAKRHIYGLASPIGDDEPTNKKYVDDSIKAAIDDSWGASY